MGPSETDPPVLAWFPDAVLNTRGERVILAHSSGFWKSGWQQELDVPRIYNHRTEREGHRVFCSPAVIQPVLPCLLDPLTIKMGLPM